MFCHVGELSHRAEFFARSRNRYFLMASITSRSLAFLGRIIKVVLPFGRRKLFVVVGSMIVVAVLQLGGVAGASLSLWQLIPRLCYIGSWQVSDIAF
jgi:hypothetical protein